MRSTVLASHWQYGHPDQVIPSPQAAAIRACFFPLSPIAAGTRRLNSEAVLPKASTSSQRNFLPDRAFPGSLNISQGRSDGRALPAFGIRCNIGRQTLAPGRANPR